MKRIFSFLLVTAFVFSFSCKNTKIGGSTKAYQLTKKGKEFNLYSNKTKQKRGVFLYFLHWHILKSLTVCRRELVRGVELEAVLQLFFGLAGTPRANSLTAYHFKPNMQT